MEKTGYLDRIFASTDTDRHNYIEMRLSDAGIKYNKSLKTTLEVAREVFKTGDVDLLVQAEKLFSKQELTLYGTEDKAAQSSLQGALSDVAIMENSLRTAQNPEKYQAAETTHKKRTWQGVPEDGFHQACNGHVTRLGNRIKTIGLSVPEKNILFQRQENMRQAKKLYVDLQRKALGLYVAPPELDNGLSR